MSDQQAHKMLLDNQEEIKSVLKEVNTEVRQINGRVSKLESEKASKNSVGEMKDRIAVIETNEQWRAKHYGWIINLGLVGSGVLLKIMLDWLLPLITAAG